jgi:hypothetical protein
VDGAAGYVTRSAVSSDPQSQEPLSIGGVANGTKARGNREVERKLSDDGSFRTASVAYGVKGLPKVLDAELHSVTSIR